MVGCGTSLVEENLDASTGWILVWILDPSDESMFHRQLLAEQESCVCLLRTAPAVGDSPLFARGVDVLKGFEAPILPKPLTSEDVRE